MSRGPAARSANPRRWSRAQLLHLFLAIGFALLLVMELSVRSRRRWPDWRHLAGLGGAGFFLTVAGVVGPGRKRWYRALLAGSVVCFVLGNFLLPG
jgi:cell division protein FtsW (lipid II flippase)